MPNTTAITPMITRSGSSKELGVPKFESSSTSFDGLNEFASNFIGEARERSSTATGSTIFEEMKLNHACQYEQQPSLPGLMRSNSGNRAVPILLPQNTSVSAAVPGTMVAVPSIYAPTAVTPLQIPLQIPPQAPSTSTTSMPHSSIGHRLQLLEMETHRTDRHTRCDGTVETESVVSSLRWFHTKVAITHGDGSADNSASVRLNAQLLYENGHEAEDQSQLEGEKQVITCNGDAEFKLKIKSLSSHREKQRFRIRISAADGSTASVVTGPIKTITKLRVTKASSMDSPKPSSGKRPAPTSDQMLRAEGGDEWEPRQVKMGRMEECEQKMEAMQQEIAELTDMHTYLLSELQDLRKQCVGVSG